MNSLIESKLSEIETLMTRYGVIRAHLFGSAADDTMTDSSDVAENFDLLSIGENIFLSLQIFGCKVPVE